jgi:hypothetical protein
VREAGLKVLAPFGRVVIFGDAGHQDMTHDEVVAAPVRPAGAPVEPSRVGG